MASFTYHYRSDKDSAKVSIRLFHSSIDYTLVTPYVSKKEYWIYRTTKNGASKTAHRKLEDLRGGEALKKHKEELAEFRERLEQQFLTDFNRGMPITREWFKLAIQKNSNVIDGKEEILGEEQKRLQEIEVENDIRDKNLLSNAVTAIFSKYLTNVKEFKKFKTTHSWLTSYQYYYNQANKRDYEFKIADFNQKFVDDFKSWGLLEMKYKLSTIIGHLKRMKRAIEYSYELDEENIKVHSRLNKLRFSSYKEQEEMKDKFVIPLSFDELDKIDKLDLTDDPELREIQKCILIGSETGLRFTDFGKLCDRNLKTHIQGIEYWEFKTSKTKKWVKIIKNDRLKYYIAKYGDPKTEYDENEDIKLNRLMKIICKKAKINESTEMEISQKVKDFKTRRYVKTILPKYKGITTRTLRRSFASNYYSHIPVELIMQVTGHTTEKMLREYINVDSEVYVGLAFEKMNELHQRRKRLAVIK